MSRVIRHLSLVLCALTLSGVSVTTSTLHGDILELKDGNLIECKLVRQERNARGVVLVVADETGEEKKYPMSQVRSFLRMKNTSWEKRAANVAWYEKKKLKVKDTWQSHAKLAKDCYRKQLTDYSTEHYRIAYLKRKAKTERTEANHMKLARWLEDCELFDESLDERRAAYEIRKEAVKDEVRSRESLAKWCQRWELLAEAAEQYYAILKLEPGNARYTDRLEQVERQLAIPMDKGFYRGTRVRVAAAARFLKKQQSSSGAIGTDIVEAGVHGQRGMTALAAMALIGDWDFGVLSGKYEPNSIPKEVIKAMDFLIDFKPRAEGLAGDDVWGPIFAMDFFLECYERPQFEPHKERLADEIDELIQVLEDLQRGDGGWNYYNFIDDSTTFVSASAIVSLVRAVNNGFELKEDVIPRAVGQIENLRQGHGTFTYSAGLSQGPIGSCARSPVCELALTMAGVGKPTALRYAVEIFLKNRHVLEGLKGSAGTHIGEGKTAPYYLLFAHYWASRAIKHLDRNQQRPFLGNVGGGLAAYQESDATFGDWTGTADYKIYGTAFASLTLYHIASLREVVPILGSVEPPKREPEESDEEEPTPDAPKEEAPKPKKPETFDPEDPPAGGPDGVTPKRAVPAKGVVLRRI